MSNAVDIDSARPHATTADALENAAKELELESPASTAFSTYCQEFDAKALKLAKYRYQKLTPEQLEMIITLRTAPFVATALSDFKRQPCDETESILLHEIIQAYWERIAK